MYQSLHLSCLHQCPFFEVNAIKIIQEAVKKSYFACVESQQAKPIIWQFLKRLRLSAGARHSLPEAPECADLSKKVTR